jgi:hypothetical protein
MRNDLSVSQENFNPSPDNALKNISVHGLNKISKNQNFFPKNKKEKRYQTQKDKDSELEFLNHQDLINRKQLDNETKNFIYKRSFTELYKVKDENDLAKNIIKSPMHESEDFHIKSEKQSNNLDSPYFSKKMLKKKNNPIETGSLKKMSNVINSLQEKNEERRIYSIGVEQEKNTSLKNQIECVTPISSNNLIKNKSKWCSLKNSIRDIGMKGINETKGFKVDSKEVLSEKKILIKDLDNLEITLGRKPEKSVNLENFGDPNLNKISKFPSPFIKGDLSNSNSDSSNMKKLNPFINTNESNEKPSNLKKINHNDFDVSSFSKQSEKLLESIDKSNDFKVIQSTDSISNLKTNMDSNDHIIKLNINSNKRVNKKKSKSVITKPKIQSKPLQKSIFSQCGSFSKVPDLDKDISEDYKIQKMLLKDLEKLNKDEIQSMLQLVDKI